MLPARFAPYLFSLILSAMISSVISGIATLRALGTGRGRGDEMALVMVGFLAAGLYADPDPGTGHAQGGGVSGTKSGRKT